MLTHWVRRRLAEVDREGGFTLAELLTYIVISSIIGTIIVTVTVSGLDQQRITQDRNTAITQARTALERIDRDIRSADPLLASSSTSITLREVQPTGSAIEYRDITYTVQAQTSTTWEIVVGEEDTSTSGALTFLPNKILITNLVNVNSSPVFLFSAQPSPYVPASGVNADCSISNQAGTYDPGCVGTITVQLQVQPSSLNAPVSISDKGTALRNLT